MNREERILKRKILNETRKLIAKDVEYLENEENKLLKGMRSEYTLDELSELIKEKRLKLREYDKRIKSVD